MDLRRGRTRLTAAVLAELVKELRPVLLGKVLRDVALTAPRDLILFFERDRDSPHAADRLHVALDPRHPRMHPVTRRFGREEFERTPFVDRARHSLRGKLLSTFRALPGDRTACMVFQPAPASEEKTPEEGEHEGSLELFLEFHGAHANAFLCDGERRVLTILRPSTPRARAHPPGTPYVLPEPPTHAHEPAGEPPSDHAMPWVDFAIRTWNVEAEEEHESETRARLERRLESARRRADDKEQGLRERLRVAEDRERFRRQGDLLKASLHLVRRGATSVRVPDYYRDPPEEIEIPLDPRKSPAENADHLYARYKKLEQALRTVAEEIAIAEDLGKRLDRARLELNGVQGIANLLTFARQLEERELLPSPSRRSAPSPKKAAPPQRLPYRSYTSFDGLEIRVGRSASDNDLLTFRHARGNDLWFHVRGTPGSHVVVPLERGSTTPPEQTVLDACCLALRWSRSAPEAGEVWFTRVKNVRKVRGAPPGKVSVGEGKTIRFRFDRERLERLERGERRALADRLRREDPDAEDVSR